MKTAEGKTGERESNPADMIKADRLKKIRPEAFRFCSGKFLLLYRPFIHAVKATGTKLANKGSLCRISA